MFAKTARRVRRCYRLTFKDNYQHPFVGARVMKLYSRRLKQNSRVGCINCSRENSLVKTLREFTLFHRMWGRNYLILAGGTQRKFQAHCKFSSGMFNKYRHKGGVLRHYHK